MDNLELKKGQEVWGKRCGRMSRKRFHEIDGRDHFIPVEFIGDSNRACHVKISTNSGDKHLVVPYIYKLERPDESQKPVVSQVAVEFYERYKDDNLDLGEWFSDFYSSEAIEDFPRMEELSEWLHGNDNETNRQREFALATLVTLGIDAVEVEKEKLYTVEIPNPALDDLESVMVLKRLRGRVCLVNTYDYMGRELSDEYRLTESEIRKDFEWAWHAGFAKEVTQ